MRFFVSVLKSDKVSKKKIKRFKRQVRMSVKRRTKRSTGGFNLNPNPAAFISPLHRFHKSTFTVSAASCTVGNITQVTISDDAFPFDYDDIDQFSACLSARVVKDNLAAITSKVIEDEHLSVVLTKLREVRDPETPGDASVTPEWSGLLW